MLRTPRGAVLGTASSPRPWPSGCSRHPARPRPQADRHQAPAGVQEQPAVHPAAGRRPAEPDDAGGEDRPDDPGRADRRRRRPVAHHDLRAGQRPVRRRLHAGQQHARGVGRHGGPLPGGGARDPARHPAALRRRLGARPRQPAGRHRLPAQHRPRRHPRPGPRGEDRAHHRDRDPGQRPAVGVRAVCLRRARRPLGPHLRELRRGPELVDQDGVHHRRAPGRPGRPRRGRTGCWPPPSTTPATG